ncbi:MAG: hypothetical protein U0264_14185 [Candidatus Kapaibacterium sp.]
MKITSSFAVLFLVLAACSGTTEPNTPLKAEAKDYVLAGGVGTELVFLQTRTDIDTNGVKKVSPSDTVFWNVIARDAVHPVGGSSVVVYEKFVRAGATTPYGGDTSYFSSTSNGIAYYRGYVDLDAQFLLKNPLSAGASWIDTSMKSGAMTKLTIESVGVTIPTTLRQFTGIRTQKQDSAMINSIHFLEKVSYFYAPEVMLPRKEEVVENTYSSGKKDTRTTVMDLIRYTKK